MVSGQSGGLGHSKKPTGDLVGGASLAGRDHDKQLHDGVIDGRTTGLDNEDILITDTGQDANTGFALSTMSASLASLVGREMWEEVDGQAKKGCIVDKESRTNSIRASKVATHIGELR